MLCPPKDGGHQKENSMCKKVVGLLLAAISLFLVAGCATTQTAEGLRQAIARTPAKNFSSYHFDSTLPLVERVTDAPDAVLKYLLEADQNETYTTYAPSAREMAWIKDDLDNLPSAYKSKLSARLLGIYFINNLLGSGIADYVLDENDRVYAILILNPEVLRHGISDWLSYREASAYTDDAAGDKGFSVRIDCGSTYTGFTYVLMHETSHILDYLEHYTPYVENDMKVLGIKVEQTPFTSPLWKDYNHPTAKNDFPLREGLHFYGTGPRTHIAHAIELYEGLGKTPFASLYGSRNWAEDFAEYLTWYYLTNVLKQPYEIQVFKDARLEFRYDPMSTPKVLQRAGEVIHLLN
jgi:hypothetical protein